jgi:hypothetical protein
MIKASTGSLRDSDAVADMNGEVLPDGGSAITLDLGVSKTVGLARSL